MILYLFNFLFFYSHVHTLFRPFLHPVLCCLPLTPIFPCLQAEPVFNFLQFCGREDISNNKKGRAFLLVEIRIAIQKYSSIASMHKCVTTEVKKLYPNAPRYHK
jgi:hypothetical protein